MKLNWMLALTATLALGPSAALPLAAAEKAAKADKTEKAEKPAAKPAADEAAAEKKPGPTDAEKAKARKQKKASYVKITGEAKAIAEKSDLPMLVALIPDGLPPAAQELEKKILKHPKFLKDFAKDNFVLVFMKLKKGNDPKKVNTRQMKADDLKFLENFGLDEKAVARAKQNNKPEPTFDDMSNYPAIVCVDPLCQKVLFRMPQYDREGGFGVWLSQVTDLLRNAGLEPTVSPAIQKIIDNPDDPKKWK